MQAVVTDQKGNVIWFCPVAALPIKPLDNGHYIVVAFSDLLEIDLAGNTIREESLDALNASLPAAGFNITAVTFHHDVIALPNGHWIGLINTFRPCTGRPECSSNRNILGDVLVDLAPQPDGTFLPVWVWNSFDHLDVTRAPMSVADWTHSNAILYSPDDGKSWRNDQGHPFTSELSGQDFWTLLQAGYAPLGMVMGVCVYHVAHRTFGNILSNLGQNAELPQFTQALYDARELAMARMQKEAEALSAEGIVGVQLDQRNHSWGAHTTEFFSIGTAVRPIRPDHEISRPQLVLSLDNWAETRLLEALGREDPFRQQAARNELRKRLSRDRLIALARSDDPRRRLGILLVLSESDGPDLTAVKSATETAAQLLKPGALIVLESTTYPGTTD